MILNTSFIDYWGAVRRCNKELIDQNNQNKIKITNQTIKEYMKKYKYNTKNQTNKRSHINKPTKLSKPVQIEILQYFGAPYKISIYIYIGIKTLSKIKLYCYGKNKLGRRIYYTCDLGSLRKWYVVIFILHKRLTTVTNQYLLQILLAIL